MSAGKESYLSFDIFFQNSYSFSLSRSFTFLLSSLSIVADSWKKSYILQVLTGSKGHNRQNNDSFLWFIMKWSLCKGTGNYLTHRQQKVFCAKSNLYQECKPVIWPANDLNLPSSGHHLTTVPASNMSTACKYKVTVLLSCHILALIVSYVCHFSDTLGLLKVWWQV